MKNDPYYQFAVGDKVSISHKITAADVEKFKNLTGDDNPLHMDDDFAKEHSFDERVGPAMLSASFISTIIGTKIPGPGALWQSQSLEFKGPTCIGDEIKVEAKLTHKSEAQRILVLAISVNNQAGAPVIRGEAKVKVLEIKEKKGETIVTEKGCAIVTGGSRGIGAEICRKLASDGYKVVVNYLQSEEAAKDVVSTIKSAGGDAASFRANISHREEVDCLVAFAREKYSKIDVLVNNASPGIVHKPIIEASWSEFENHFNAQVRGVFNTVQSVLPHFIELKRGRIINITSAAADAVPPTKTYGYTVAKSALTTFTRCLAVELGPLGIFVNNVSPGMTETSLLSSAQEKTKVITAMQTPLRRLGSVEDTANTVSFLANPSTTYITGETLRVCGGQQMI